jgi:hypothetical protein
MSVAPELARLAGPALLVPAQAAGRPGAPGGDTPEGPSLGGWPAHPTLGTLARLLRSIAATPERWWSLVRFEPDRSVEVTVDEGTGHRAWLVVLPPGDAGRTCDCDVATMIAGEATEGTPAGAVLRPGSLRVHGQRHRLRGQGEGYSISLHVRAHRPPAKNSEAERAAVARPGRG